MNEKLIDELSSQLSEDLEALNMMLQSVQPLQPSHVRITASAVLRKWFIEGWIDKLAKYADVKYTFKSIDTTKIVNAIGADNDIQFFMTGGVLMDGVQIQGYYVSDKAANENGKPDLPINELQYKLFKPSELMKSKRVFFKGTWFNFSEIIKFCANKYGGVHFDKNYTKQWQKNIEDASNYFIVGNPDNQNERKIIEPYSDNHKILLVLPKEKNNIWNCLDIELLSLAGAFLNIHVNGENIAKPEK